MLGGGIFDNDFFEYLQVPSNGTVWEKTKQNTTPSPPKKQTNKKIHVKATKTTLSAVKRPIKVQGRQKLWIKQYGISNIHA